MDFDELGQSNPLPWAMQLTSFLIETCFSQIMLDYPIA